MLITDTNTGRWDQHGAFRTSAGRGCYETQRTVGGRKYDQIHAGKLDRVGAVLTTISPDGHSLAYWFRGGSATFDAFLKALPHVKIILPPP